MNILGVRTVALSNFKSAWSLLSTLFVREARALLCTSSLQLWGVGTNVSEDRFIFLRSEPISTILEHGFNVRAWRTGTESSKTRWVITIEVRLNIPWSMHSQVNGLSASRN